MTIVKSITTLILTAGFALAGTAFAQDSTFIAADANTDNVLDRDEFVTFVGLKAEAGDEAHIAIRDSGDYETPFKKMDKNEDGVLDAAEAG